jgi:hypothetical protein
MQSIDPSFDEKDAGCNRFSKFVVESGHRGLLSIEKMDNGQYAVDVGDNANLPPEEEAELRKTSSGGERSSKSRRRRGGSRRKSEEDGGELTLSAAFDLLRQTLADATDADAGVDAEQVHASMAKLHGDEADPMFERRRFQRMLRQAHDANVVELAKVDGEYRLKPGPKAAPAANDAPSEDVAGKKGAAADAGGSTSRTRTKKSSRGRTRAPRKKPEEETPASADATAEAEVQTDDGGKGAGKEPAAKEAAGETPKRNPRYRRGTRGGTKPRKDVNAPAETLPGKVAEGSTPSSSSEPTKEPKGKTAVPETDAAKAKPPVGGRSGSRGRGRRTRRPAGESDQEAKPTESKEASSAPRAPEPEARQSSAAPARQDAPATMPTQQPSLFDGGGGDDESLFRRMSAALQRVMRGTEGE